MDSEVKLFNLIMHFRYMYHEGQGSFQFKKCFKKKQTTMNSFEPKF